MGIQEGQDESRMGDADVDETVVVWIEKPKITAEDFKWELRCEGKEVPWAWGNNLYEDIMKQQWIQLVRRKGWSLYWALLKTWPAQYKILRRKNGRITSVAGATALVSAALTASRKAKQ
jgi:hypothetical protein